MAFKIGLCGYSGKMGQAISAAVKNFPEIEISAKFNSSSGSLEEFCRNCETIIDFSDPSLLKPLLKACVENSTGAVIGTTGLSESDFDFIKKASEKIALIYAPNTSIGANLLFSLAAEAAAAAPGGYGISIIERHRKDKKDSPSGTSIRLRKSIAEKSGLAFDKISIDSVREGDIFGEHEVIFSGRDEIFSIAHKAVSRECFASGAIRAALWLKGKEPGLYSMSEVFKF